MMLNKGRDDVVAPATGHPDTIRNDNCRALFYKLRRMKNEEIDKTRMRLQR